VDDRQAQFLIAAAALCADAHIGRLEVEVLLADGGRLSGVPDPPRDTRGPDEFDHTGQEDEVGLDGVRVPLSQLVEIRLRRP
jgi:hypothetical protein